MATECTYFQITKKYTSCSSLIHIYQRSRHFGNRHFGIVDIMNRHFGTVEIMGIDIFGKDILGIDILGIDILALPQDRTDRW